VLNLRGYYGTLGETIRHAAFQVSSIMTTTGYATTDFDRWPSFSKAILLCLMVIGACAGSTGGGLKCSRVVLLLKGLRRNIHQVLHPQKVQVIRVNDQAVDEKILANTNAYLSAYVIIVMAALCSSRWTAFPSRRTFPRCCPASTTSAPGWTPWVPPAITALTACCPSWS
jgi:trk system potassium uptake protein TrkH